MEIKEVCLKKDAIISLKEEMNENLRTWFEFLYDEEKDLDFVFHEIVSNSVIICILNNLRQRRLKDKFLTSKEFYCLYNRDRTRAVSQLFKEPLEERIVEFLINERELSPEEIYEKHQNDKEKTFTKMFL